MPEDPHAVEPDGWQVGKDLVYDPARQVYRRHLFRTVQRSLSVGMPGYELVPGYPEAKQMIEASLEANTM